MVWGDAMKRLVIISLVGLLGVLVLAGMLFTLFITDNPASISATPTDSLPQVVAIVNGEAITRDMVEAEVKVSRFNVVEPLPPLTGDDLARAQEEAVNQLITRHLILQAASRQKFALDEAFVQDRVDLLFGTYGDEALNQALQQGGVTRADLSWWIREIFTVEEFTSRVIMAAAQPENRQQVYNDWLNDQRAAADINTYLHGEAHSLLALVGEPAPEFTLSSLDGQPVSLADYNGKVVLVNFWATWCPSCVTEMPDYEQIYQQFGRAEGDFMVLGVNFQEGRQYVQQYASDLGLTFPVLLDRDGNVTNRQYQVTGMPASVIVDQQGVIFYRHLGPMSGETLLTKLAELGL